MKAQKNRIMHRLLGATAYCLYCVLLPIVFASPCLGAADMDGDGLDDAWETANGYSTSLYTHIVHVDAVNGDDAAGDGLSASTALKSLGAALALNFTQGRENVVLAAPGTYSGAGNRELDFGGRDIWLRSSGGAGETVVDLEGAGRFLTLTHGETLSSRLDGFTIRNGYKASCGTAVSLSGASLDIRNCVFDGNRSGRKVRYEYGDGDYEEYWTDGEDTAAVYASGGVLAVADCVFSDNVSEYVDFPFYYMDGTGSCGAVSLVNSTGSSLVRCVFSGNRGVGAGAVLAAGSCVTLDSCRLLGNQSMEGGGAVTLRTLWHYAGGEYTELPAEAEMENCLFRGNRSRSSAADVLAESGTSFVARNCTGVGDWRRSPARIAVNGDAELLNCIVPGDVEVGNYGTLSAAYCCSPQPLSAFGSGNMTASPCVSPAGLLLQSSPCIDAGAATADSPASDILGRARPSGAAVDIGCHEFTDADGDGIPDALEGSGVAPQGDLDGDGIANIDEFIAGTGLGEADTDGDGLEDGEEIRRGFDPLRRTRIIYVDGEAGDDERDGKTAQRAVRTIGRAVELSGSAAFENIISVAPGTYAGAGNRGLDFHGFDMKLVAAGGSASTVIDLEGHGPFLNLHSTESLDSRIDGFTVRNGYAASYGIAVSLEDSSLDIRNCVFEGNRSGRLESFGGIGGYWTDGFSTAAVFASGAPVRITGTVFRNNVSRGQEMGMDSGNAGAVLLSSSDGSVIDGCEFIGNMGFGAGAVIVSNASADFLRSRFLHNLSQGTGGALSVNAGWYYYDGTGGGTSVSIADCLFLGNRAIQSCSDISLANGCDATVGHVTVSGGTSADGVSVSFGGDTEIHGSIISGNASVAAGVSFSAWDNCTVNDWSSYGTGNIASDPMLTGAGMLRAGSPCIDAGDAANAPSSDIFGNARPAGNAADIGCHEFADTDGDGIPDFLEGESGILPGGDEDGDGVSNLQEYLLGTDVFAEDTDGDGLEDGEEIRRGFDPLRRTAFVYVSTSGNDSLEGRSQSSPKRTFASAVEACQEAGMEHVVIAASGTYTGAGNRGLDFHGFDMKLVSAGGSASTVIDLEGHGPFLNLHSSESPDSRLDGFTVRNGYAASHGTAVNLENASLDIRNCVFENNCSGRLVSYDYGGRTESYWEDACSTAAVYASGAPVRISGTVFRNNVSRETTTGGGMDAGNAGAVLLAGSDGSSVDHCDFIANSGFGAGAVVLDRASAVIRGSRFLRNFSYSDGGAVSVSAGWDYYYYENEAPPHSVSLENCLLLGNRALDDFSDLNFGERCGAHVVNCTIAGGSSWEGHAIRFGGSSSVVNCIVSGIVDLGDSISFMASNNCTPFDWSLYGTGNIVSDPMLTGAGMLRAGSPCIDAGDAANAPSSDIFGNARPAGNAADIGCHEFADTDGDGIPDFLEGESGILPGGDEDGDGVSNLQEYLLGTDVFAEDTDGDGICDGAELSGGLDPLRPVRMLYVSADGNDSNSGLTALTAKRTLAAAVAAMQDAVCENVIQVLPGTYSGASNRGISFNGYDVKLVSTGGAGQTIIDLDGAGPFLNLNRHETPDSRLDGFTVRNGYAASHGTAVNLENASLDIRNCVFENNCSGRLVSYDYGGRTESYWEDACSTAAVYASGAPVRITGTVFRNNVSRETMWGGGMDAGNAGAVLLSCSEGSVVDHCDFVANSGFGAGAVVLDRASAVIRGSRFLRNFSYSAGGAVSATAGWDYYYYGEDAPVCSVGLENCLFLGNRAMDDYSDLNIGNLCGAHVVNCTIAGGVAFGGHAAKFGCDASVANTILTGCTVCADGMVFSASNNCTPDDWSLYGTGNIASDPMLTGAGMLRAGSPCIDAGGTADAPSSDIFGNARPAGCAADIGCHEFLDSDADGIPDFIEVESGILPGGDEDEDGLSNLQEYLLGTDVFAEDTDGDGMSDADEMEAGQDPLFPSRTIHVSPSGSDANDGLSATRPKRSIVSAVDAACTASYENIVLLASGIYSGPLNTNIGFNGYDIRIVSEEGAQHTVIDLQGAGRFLNLTCGETFRSSIEGLTVRNGYAASHGTAVNLENASLDIRNCVFENNCSGKKVTYDRGNGLVGTYWEDACSTAAVYASGAPVRITGTVFRNNVSRETTTGGGMDAGNAGAVLLVDSEGSSVDHCDFVANSGFGAGAVVLDRASAVIRGSRFLRNFSYSDGGAVSVSAGWDYYYYENEAPPHSVSLENCLLLGNRALDDFSDLNFGERCGAHVVNCTIAGGVAFGGHAAKFGCDASVANTILGGSAVCADGVDFTASNNCTPADWSLYGTGNIVSDPMLTDAGMLRAGSPCIDAGDAANAPSSDIFGNARPAGNAADIGCHEFADTDGDGIPDFLEGESGILPGGDEDGDGVSNLQEYLLGTDVFAEDTDGDGMSDGGELASGRDPLLPANIVYVSPSGRDSADGRTPATARATFAAALELARRGGTENIIHAAAGTYAGSGNCSLDFEGFDISIRGAAGDGVTTIDLAEGTGFLSLHSGETCGSRLSGLAFVRGRGASPAIALDGAGLAVSGCSFRNFSSSGNSGTYMFYDHDFSSACVLRLVNSSCRLEDVEIAYCSYSPDCPLFSGSNSEISLDRCRIVGNETGCGPLFRVYGTAIHMVNTMVAKNNVASTGGIAILYGDSLLRTVNSTFAANAPSAAASISGDGAVDMLNTVFEDLVSGCGVSLSHCVVAPAYADAASGCISGGAGLAGGLFLTPDSPCIDAGAQSGAPDVDFAGTPRPQGAGVDIGCEEYRDFDGDGISDFYSAWCGGNLSADGDLDGDGLSNLQEMNIGTDAGSSDTDGDGMADGWEISCGLDPLHDDADDDPDGDGLANIEEFLAGTDPSDPDTDGDGQTDGWEVKTAFSDPAAADFNGSSDSVVIVTGNLFSDSGGGWEADGSGACARGRAGWLQYSVLIPYDGVYLLELDVSEAGTASAGSFTVSCRVDGASCGSLLRIPLDASLSGTGVCMTPFLRTGLHSVRIDWDNVYRNTSLRVDSVRLVALGGPDADGDGVPDWAETRLANMSCTALPERSRVSPLCVEGGNASYIEAIEVSGYYVAPGGDDPHPPVRRIAGNRWYADLPLDPDGTTPVSVAVSYQNSAVTVSGDVLWETVDTASLDGDTVRLDDEMLLGAELPEGVLEWTLEVGGTSFRMTRGEVRRHKFTTAGDVPVTASWTEAGGEAVSNEAVVHVLSADFGSEPVCHAGTERTWRIAGIGDGIHVEIDRDVQSTDLGCSAGARRFLLRGAVPAIAHATARVAENGPVLDTTAVHVIETATHVGDGYHRVIADFGDGTVLYDGYVVAGQVVEGMSVRVTLWGTNSTFEDGTQEKTFTWESFDASGELHFSILGGRSFTTCMTVALYQDGEMVWNLQ